MLKYGTMTEFGFVERELYDMTAKGFKSPMKGRHGTYDQYVMDEIHRSYGMLECEGKIVLDVGANIGCFTKMALEKGAKKVISIEPEPHNYDMLDLNTDEFADRMNLYNHALTPDVRSKISLFVAPSGKNPGNSSINPRRGREEIKVTTISVEALLELNPGIQVAKIDCEGAEFELIPELIKCETLEQIAVEFHISGYGTRPTHDTHSFLIRNGWVATRQPKIQDNLWQTLAAYRKIK